MLYPVELGVRGPLMITENWRADKIGDVGGYNQSIRIASLLSLAPWLLLRSSLAAIVFADISA
jgi:hypothetical protein